MGEVAYDSKLLMMTQNYYKSSLRDSQQIKFEFLNRICQLGVGEGGGPDKSVKNK